MNSIPIPIFFFLTGMLPQPLAIRISKEIYEIFEEIYEKKQQQDPVLGFFSRTGLNVESLELAAAQKTWPTYPMSMEDVLEVFANPKSLG